MCACTRARFPMGMGNVELAPAVESAASGRCSFRHASFTSRSPERALAGARALVHHVAACAVAGAGLRAAAAAYDETAARGAALSWVPATMHDEGEALVQRVIENNNLPRATGVEH